MTKQAELSANSWRIAWSVVFAANLVVTLILGWPMCGPDGKVGLALAVAGYWSLGILGLAGEKRWGRALVYGGIPVGLSQFFPMAQIYAGIFATGVWSRLAPGLQHPIFHGSGFGLPLVGGFVVTGVTGALLMTAAFLIGWVLLKMFPEPSTSKPKLVLDDEF